MEIVNLTGSLAPSSDESMTPFEVTLKSGDDVRLVFTIEPARPTQTLTAATCRFQLAQSAFSDPLVEKVATAESARSRRSCPRRHVIVQWPPVCRTSGPRRRW